MKKEKNAEEELNTYGVYGAEIEAEAQLMGIEEISEERMYRIATAIADNSDYADARHSAIIQAIEFTDSPQSF